ncbi:MAG: integron integrase [Kiritimatiellae bacterium]|nr:integron integrase [Kiritimatiellia bacterium]
MDFWGGFLDYAIENGISGRHARWYVDWAVKFARAIRGVSLRKRSIEDVKGFLEDLQADENVAPWQIEQARKALRLLYSGYMGIDPKSMPKLRGDKARDRVDRPHEMEQKHGDLLEAVENCLKMKHYSPRTQESYLGWAKRFIAFHKMQAPEKLSADDIKAFLNYLAVERGVSSSTQNQGLNAIVFLYSEVLKRKPGDFSDFTRAKMPSRIPVSLSVKEMTALLSALREPHHTMALIMYGSGLRIMECLRLKVCDIYFDQKTIHVREGKGAKDRFAILPEEVVKPLRRQIESVRELFGEDKIHEQGLEWSDQFIFPSNRLRVDIKTRRVSRTHRDHNGVKNVLAAAAKRAGIPHKVTPHVLRHSFATHMYEQGHHILTIQELMGHASHATTMIYTHPMNRPGKKAESPLRAWYKG